MSEQEQLKSECVQAFKQKNQQEAERLLPQIEQPADIRTTDYVPGVSETSLLHVAAAHGWMDIIIDLITKYKCDTSCKDSEGSTPLHYAVSSNYLEVVRYFINEQHRDPMARANNGDTPLHIACRYGYLEIVQYLITEAQCNPSCENKYHDTPLHYASDYSHIHIIRYLLSTGIVNPLAKNDSNETPMYTVSLRDKSRRKLFQGVARLHLLHIAAAHGWMNIIIDLIKKYLCDTNCRNLYGHTPLHYAVSNDHLEVVKYFINEQHCDPMTRDKYGNTPLHYACNCGQAQIVRYLLSTGKVDPLAKNKNDENPIYKQGYKNRISLLHLAAAQGWMNITIDLITKYKCDINAKDSRERTPLHYAVSNDHLEVVKYFVNEQHCDPMARDNDGNTLLHYACNSGHAQIVRYLLSTGKVDPLAKNKNDENPIYKQGSTNRISLLHLAASQGWMDVVSVLTKKYKCDSNCSNSHGHLPLHSATIGNHLEVVRYLINEQHCDPMTRDIDGNTPLHIACRYGNANVVQYLLSTGKVDLLAENNNKETPVDIATQINRYDLLKLFKSFPQCEKDFPVHTYTKLILTGYSGAGKTTISQLIFLLANKTGFFSWLASGRVPDVECLTAGIIPIHVESKVNEVGNMVIYDFAGQREYYSSHAAVLEHIMRNSAAIFVCMVDLRQCMDEISESIHYWISFIENACSSAHQGSSHVIIVGSHADWINSSQELKEKSSLVESIAKSRVKQQLMYKGFVRMDCRESKTKEAHYFRSLLSTSQQAILSSQPSMNLYCHVLYAFLRTKLEKTGCTLQELTYALASAENFSPDSALLTESLTLLSDKGLILFVQNQECPWVVVKKEALLREVNGTLFAPGHFKQYRQVASNTGIVPIAVLEELFPQYSSEMLVGCLENMEFCHPVDITTLQATNLKATLSSPTSGNSHLFFPSLVKEHRPSDLPSPKFGWCLGCSDPHQFFSNRFLHILFLRLAFKFSLASRNRSLSASLHGLERKCSVWQKGICWKK